MKASLIKKAFVLSLVLIQPIVLMAETTNETSSEASSTKESTREKDRKSVHQFKHEIEYPTRSYENPVSASWKTGAKGALVGLGTGLAVHLIGYSVSGKSPKESGRITAGLTGVGFLAGAAFGGISAYMSNQEIEKREGRMLEQYGSITPSVIFADAGNGAGLGLNYSLRF